MGKKTMSLFNLISVPRYSFWKEVSSKPDPRQHIWIWDFKGNQDVEDKIQWENVA
jgi:hypothetical protein